MWSKRSKIGEETKNNFDKIARIGNGKSMYLDVKHQNKSVALLQSALSESILCKMANGGMKLVQTFRQQNRNLPQFL